MEQAQSVRLRLPDQDLMYLTLGSDNPRKLQAWVDELPALNMGETSRQLYQYLQELNRFRTDPQNRYLLLEIVRPAIIAVCAGLGKHYLSQSLVLPEKARRIASLAQTLQVDLNSGYKLVAAGCLRKISDKDYRQTLAQAIHRAISASTDVLLRCYQLYFPTPRHLWLELHQLYLLSELNKLNAVEVKDTALRHIESSTIQEAYVRCLLLATAKPNQLRQQELALLHEASEEWSGLVEIKRAADSDDLFVFDLNTDRPPTYRTHVSVARDGCRYIDATMLVNALDAVAEAQKPADFAVPKGVTDSLVNHIRKAWGALTERSFKRVSQNVPLDICFGLGALHYFSSEGEDFASVISIARDDVLAGSEENPFMVRRQSTGFRQAPDEDPWSKAFDGGGYKMANDAALEAIDLTGITSALQQKKGEPGKNQSFDYYRCETVNVSPGGYCLAWQGDSPAQLRTGELVGILEERTREWAVGVLRWVKQMTNQGAQFGVELLAPKALPAGGRVLKKTGEPGEFLRVLLLPDMPAIGQPVTLLVPVVGFQTGAKVELVYGGRVSKIQLHRKVNSTASFGQYEFRIAGERSSPDSAASTASDAEDFNSIWSSL